MGLGIIDSEPNDACVEVWMRDNDGRPLCLKGFLSGRLSFDGNRVGGTIDTTTTL